MVSMNPVVALKKFYFDETEAFVRQSVNQIVGKKKAIADALDKLEALISLGEAYSQVDTKRHLQGLSKLKEQLSSVEANREGINEMMATFARNLSPISADGGASVFAFSDEPALSLRQSADNRSRQNNVIYQIETKLKKALEAYETEVIQKECELDAISLA